MRLVLALLLMASTAGATIRFVDGGCTAANGGPGFDGDGTSTTCAASAGAAGPFFTVSECVIAGGGSPSNSTITTGDRCEVRGPHDAFNGIYTETLLLQNSPPAPLTGKPWDCSTGATCYITGCRQADGCPEDDTATINSLETHSDWHSDGGGIYDRVMEAAVQADNTGGLRTDGNGPYDPYIVYAVTGNNTYAPLAYSISGDTITTPEEGSWSFQVDGTHRIFVHPTGGGDPTTTIAIPNFTYIGQWYFPTRNVTIQYLNFQGGRAANIDLCQSGNPCSNITLQHGWNRYIKRYGVHSHHAFSLHINDFNTEFFGRGVSFHNVSAGTFAWRIFWADGGLFENSIVQHGGEQGTVNQGNFQCVQCDPPWNSASHTYRANTGIGIQVKQTVGFTVRNSTFLDLETGAVGVDVTRDMTVNDITATRMGTCINATNTTPDASSGRIRWSGLLVDRVTCIDTGQNDIQHCAFAFAGDDSSLWGSVSTFLARVANVDIIRPGFAALCVGTQTANQTTAPGGIEMDNISVYGVQSYAGAPHSRALIAAMVSSNGGLHLHNWVTDGLTDEQYVFSGTAAPFTGGVSATSLVTTGDITNDHNRFGTNGASFARSGATVPLGRGQPTGGTTYAALSNYTSAFSNQETGSTAGAPGYVAAPNNLALTSGSACRNAGTNISWFTDDITNQTRTGTYDIGAHAFFSGSTTTTVTTTTVTTSSTATTTTATTTTLPVTPPGVNVF